ncbi:MAG: thioredoxin family protein [Gemmatimonadaceae bacterium]|nr:thioredoxin family protein [Gemmatimonadaceae bacterium]
MTLRERYYSAPTFDAFLEGVETNSDLWHAIARRASVPDDVIARVEATGQRWHLLVLTEDWCGDGVNVLPYIAKLADGAANLDLRILARDANPDLMDGHLTGQSRSIPVVILLDSSFTERGWWGPRPRELQQWVLGPGSSMPKADRYRDIRRWYVQDRGFAVLNGIVSIIEAAVAKDAAA